MNDSKRALRRLTQHFKEVEQQSRLDGKQTKRDEEYYSEDEKSQGSTQNRNQKGRRMGLNRRRLSGLHRDTSRQDTRRFRTQLGKTRSRSYSPVRTKTIRKNRRNKRTQTRNRGIKKRNRGTQKDKLGCVALGVHPRLVNSFPRDLQEHAIMLHRTKMKKGGYARKGEKRSYKFFPPKLHSSGNVGYLGGSEYVDVVTINNVTHAQPTSPGDTVFILHLAPRNFTGSKLKQFAELYQKYNYISMVFEWKPEGSDLQNGLVVMNIDYEQDDNQSLIHTDPNERMRLMLGKDSTIEFMVRDYGSVSYKKKPSSLKWYYTNLVDTDPTEHEPAFFQIMAASRYNPVYDGETTQSLGQIIVHYLVKFITPELEDPTDDSQQETVVLNGVVFEAIFKTFEEGFPVDFIDGVGFPVYQPNYMYIFRTLQTMTLDTSTPDVTSEHGTSRLFTKGSVPDSSSPGSFLLRLFPDYRSALFCETENALYWTHVIPNHSTNEVTTTLVCEALPLD